MTLWEKHGDAYHATVTDTVGRVTHHLAAEPSPDGSWTWTIWHPGDPPSLSRYGTAGTAQEAMQAAEQAVQ